MTNHHHFHDTIEALEAEVAGWRARIEETLPVIEALKVRLQPQPPPPGAPKRGRPRSKPSPKNAPRKPAAAPKAHAAPTDADEARRAKSRESMRRYRAKKAAVAQAFPEPPAADVIIRDGVRWVKDAAGSLSREHSAEPPPSPLIGRESSSSVRRRGNADAAA
jgi:hypothetical protein